MPTSLCILPLSAGKERCISKTWKFYWSQEPGQKKKKKKSVIVPTNQCLQKCYPPVGKTTVPPPTSTSLPCSCLAVLPPERTRPCVLYWNNSSNNARILLPSPIFSESSPLKRGSICSNAKAQGLPSPMPGSFSLFRTNGFSSSG